MNFSDANINPATWHGLTDVEVLRIFDRQDWALRVMTCLREIALDQRAHADQRLRALVEMNKGLTVKILPSVADGHYQHLACLVMLQIGEGCAAAHGWRARRHQKKIEQRLEGLMQMVRTVVQFVPLESDAVAAPGPKTHGVEALLS